MSCVKVKVAVLGSPSLCGRKATLNQNYSKWMDGRYVLGFAGPTLRFPSGVKFFADSAKRSFGWDYKPSGSPVSHAIEKVTSDTAHVKDPSGHVIVRWTELHYQKNTQHALESVLSLHNDVKVGHKAIRKKKESAKSKLICAGCF